MLRVHIKLRLDFNQLPLKMQKGSVHVLTINKTRLYSTMNSTDEHFRLTLKLMFQNI